MYRLIELFVFVIIVSVILPVPAEAGRAEPLQVRLNVKFAEIDRTAIRDFGIDYRDIGGELPNAEFGSVQRPGDLFRSTRSSAGSPSELSVNDVLRALQQSGLSRTLSEPSLTILGGESASIDARKPIDIPSRDGNQTVQINSGVRLDFADPVVFDVETTIEPGRTRVAGRIRMTLDIEMDYPEFEGGANLPKPDIHRASTSIEIFDGQTAVIAGLLGEETRTQARQIPGLGAIPILGSLFRSSDYLTGKTDLVIFVTARLVGPVGSGGSSGSADAGGATDGDAKDSASGVANSNEFATTTELDGNIVFFDLNLGYKTLNIGQSAFGTFTDTETAVGKTADSVSGVSVGGNVGACVGKRLDLGFNTDWVVPGWDTGYDGAPPVRTLPQENTEFSRKCETQVGIRGSYFDADGDSRASEQAGGQNVGFLFLRDNPMLGFTGTSLGMSGIDVETETEAEGFSLAPYVQTTYFTKFFDDEDTADPNDGTGLRVTGGLDLRFSWSGAWHESLVTTPSFDPLDVRQETSLDVEQDFFGIGYRLEADILQGDWGVKLGGSVAPGFRYQMGKARQRNVCLLCGGGFDFEQEEEFDESGFGLQGELYAEGFYYITPDLAAYAGVHGTLETGVIRIVTPEAESQQPTQTSTGTETSVTFSLGLRYQF